MKHIDALRRPDHWAIRALQPWSSLVTRRGVGEGNTHARCLFCSMFDFGLAQPCCRGERRWQMAAGGVAGCMQNHLGHGGVGEWKCEVKAKQMRLPNPGRG